MVEVKKGIYWVGAVDWSARDFHGYYIARGTTYNAYLIVDEKIALVDFVKHGFEDVLIDRIKKIVDPKEIDYLVCNHVEMDHSFALNKMVKIAKDAEVVTNSRAKEHLSLHYDTSNWSFRIVKTGDEISLGSKTLRFIEAPMVHWPDSMFTYVVEDKVLMPNDAFGQHIATSERFADEVPEDIVYEATKDYYANILTHLATQIRRKLEELEKLDIEIIAPSHGLIWRGKEWVEKVVSWYRRWANHESEEYAVVVFDSMWHSTETMAQEIAKGISDKGVKVRVFHLRKTPLSFIMREILEAKAIVVGTSTQHNEMLPSVGAFLTYIKGFRIKNKIATAFGSYGWGGGGVRNVMKELKAMGLETIDPLEIRFVPKEKEKRLCYEFGEKIAEKIKEV